MLAGLGWKCSAEAVTILLAKTNHIGLVYCTSQNTISACGFKLGFWVDEAWAKHATSKYVKFLHVVSLVWLEVRLGMLPATGDL